MNRPTAQILPASPRLYGSPGICIAVLDGPVDLLHECFAGASMTVVESVTPNANLAGAAAAHGTHVASVLFGQPDTGVDGLVPKCRGLVIPVFRDGPDGRIENCSQLDLARAISLAVEHDADVINISAGQLEPSGEAYPILLDAIELCRANGVLVVAAAGNDGCDCLHVPAAIPAVIAVGAMDSLGNPLDFSNWGGTYFENGILANGEAVLGARAGGGTIERSGTSYATPIVSGAAALLLSVQHAVGGVSNPDLVRGLIFESAISKEVQPALNADKLLTGRLNLKGALRLLYEEITSEAEIRESEITMSHIAPQETVEDPKPIPEPPVLEQQSAAEMPPQVAPASLPHNHVAPSDEVQDTVEIPAVPAASATEPQAAAAPIPAPAAMQAQVATASPPTALAPAALAPSECAECAAEAESSASLAYALGTLDYDLISEARRDSLMQMGLQNPYDRTAMVEFLGNNPTAATAISWVLSLEGTPLYVIQPTGPFASSTYDMLRRFLNEQLTEGVERISVPGWVSGTARLFNGATIPVLWPEARGMYSWSTDAVVEAVIGSAPTESASDAAAEHEEKRGEIENFLERVYYEVSNLGVLPQDRALNFAATNAYQVERVYHSAILEDMKLDAIEVNRSTYCRPESDCWDVKLRFFNPSKRMEQAREVFRFTVDVSDLIPVTVGKVRRWHMY